MLFGAHLLDPDTLLNNEEAPYYSHATLTCTYAQPYPVWQRMVMNSSVTLGYRHFHGLRSGSDSHRSPTLGRGVKHDGGECTLALSLAGYSSGICPQHDQQLIEAWIPIHNIAHTLRVTAHHVPEERSS